MSELVAIEDLDLLDGGDLRAVFDQVPIGQVLEALAGVSRSRRHLLLRKLPAASAARLGAALEAFGPVSSECQRSAQRAVVEALCRLSRAGQVAFDDPEDMVA